MDMRIAKLVSISGLVCLIGATHAEAFLGTLFKGAARTAARTTTKVAKPRLSSRVAHVPATVGAKVAHESAVSARNARISADAVRSERVVLLDRYGHPIRSNASSDAAYRTYRRNAEMLFQKVLDDVPIHKRLSEAELERILRASLQKAVTGRSIPIRSALNVNTGKLTMVFKVRGMDFTAEVNAYSIVKSLVVLAGGYGAYQATRE